MRSKRVNVWFLLMLAMSALATGAPATADDWPRYGHDRALTGRSPLMGDIDSPRVAWTYSFAGRELLVELTPETGGHDLCLDADTKIEPGPHGIAPPAPPELDLDGSGVLRPVRESYHERWARFSPTRPVCSVSPGATLGPTRKSVDSSSSPMRKASIGRDSSGNRTRRRARSFNR